MERLLLHIDNFFFGEAGATLTINEGPEPGGEFPIGDTDVDFDVNLANGEVVNCQFTVTVVEWQNPTSTLACNDNVQVSLGLECTAFVSTDMILEGGPYSCYDNYLVAVEGYGEGFGGVEIDGDAVNEVLTVTVTDTLTGNSCWGTLTVEDKIPPVIMCDTITLPCGVDTDPAQTPPGQGAFSETQSDLGLPLDNGNPNQMIEFFVDAPLGFAVTDVNVALNITHTWSDDIQAILVAPNGTQVTLAELSCTLADDWDVTFDDDSANPFMCNPTPPPALSGEMQAQGSLADFNGGLAAGNWILMVNDLTPVVDDGTWNSATLWVTYEELQANEPIASDNCGEVTLDYEDTEVGDDCTGGAIERLWTATDGSGNTATCIQVINIEPLTLDQVQCPPAYEGECGESTDPSNTGYATVAGVPLDNGSVCNIFADYWDKEFPACGNGTKILRTWTFLDWCTQETTECTQVIKLDATGVNLICPPDVTVGSDPWNCYADVILEEPTVNDNCGGANFTLEPTASAGTIVQWGPYWRLEDAPLGTTTITWNAVDECENESSCSYDITVVDDVPPVPLCDEHTIVSLTTDLIEQGLTKVPATVFDDGSYDNCGDVTFTARRMDSCIDFDWTTGGACVDDIQDGFVRSPDKGTAFRPCVPFACCDVAAGPIMVVLRVEDEAGNVNECMVEVEVQDKLSPFIVAPPSVVVSCEFWFDAAETNGFVPQEEDVLTPVFGRVLDAFDYAPEDRQDIIIDDPGNDELPQPYNWGKEGWADDNCDVDITVRVRIWDDCSGDDLPPGAPSPYAVRLIERTFLATDGQDNAQNATQRIWVVDFEPFYISDEDCTNRDRQDGVIWPCDEEYDFCPQDGIPVNYPEIFDDNCSLIGVTYEDTRFDFVDGACYKILREWTVIDWCQYDPVEQTGIWRYIQVIKVIDSEPTFILGCPQEPVIASVLSDNPVVTLPDNNQVFLGEDNPLSTSCSVHVYQTLGLSEFCSDEVTYDVKVYPFNGSDFLQIHEKTLVQLDSVGNGEMTLDTRNSDILAVRLNGLPYNDRYCSNWPFPGGEKDFHRVLWTVEDGCGNLNTCEYLLRLEDRKAPSPVCVGLSSVVMPSSGSVTIWASDFNASSFDDCTPAADLLYSFSGDTYEPSRVFDCAALEANGSPQFLVEIWVADQGNDQDCDGFRPPNQNDGILDGIEWEERNKDFCTTFIIIDDNEGACDSVGGSFGGVIETEDIEPVELVSVNMFDKDGILQSSFTTDKDGIYHFVNPLFDYTVEAAREDDPMNGVSTLDLVKIQKHLLGIEDLGSPYKLIAADANNSESVSAIDLVELRKLILGLYSELPNNASWRFVDATQAFADEANPWPFNEVIDIAALSMGNDFVGVKVGDVNGNVVANANQIETRNAKGILTLEAAEQSVTSGEEVVVAISSADFNNILGYQFTLNTEGLELTDVTAGAIDMSAENVGVHTSSIAASWFRTDAASVDAEEVLFTMTFTATQNGNLSDMMSLSSRITTAEAYNGGEELLDVALTFRSENVSVAKDFALFQNSPNPFNGETMISFTLPEAMSATLTVFDLTGKVVYTLDGDYQAGYNEVNITKNQLSATGVMYYRLDADDFTATKKMVIIN